MTVQSHRRIHFLDEVRGFAVLCMVVQHGLYCLGYIYKYEVEQKLFQFFFPATPFFAAAFVIISGMVSQLSRSNLKRGLRLLVVALGMTLVTWIVLPNYVIMFGVLHMLSVCMILFGLLQKPLEKVPMWLGLLVCVVGFTLTVGLRLQDPYVGVPGVPELQWSALREWGDWLFPIGIRTPEFHSSDFYPLFPWIFAFFGGGLLGRYVAKEKLPEWMYHPHASVFSWVGRHALLFYILHQPVIMACAQLGLFIYGKIV